MASLAARIAKELSGPVNWQMWVKLDDNRSGWLLVKERSNGIRVNQGQVEYVMFDAASASWKHAMQTGVHLPADGRFHHLLFRLHPAKASLSFSLDFGPRRTIGPVPRSPRF